MTKRNESTEERRILGMICDVIQQFNLPLQHCRVFLFGSRAAGTAHTRSDFDIGVYGKEPLPLVCSMRFNSSSMSLRPYTASIGSISAGWGKLSVSGL
jgi:predicted nucleotidyltransferase